MSEGKERMNAEHPKDVGGEDGGRAGHTGP